MFHHFLQPCIQSLHIKFLLFTARVAGAKTGSCWGLTFHEQRNDSQPKLLPSSARFTEQTSVPLHVGLRVRYLPYSEPRNLSICGASATTTRSYWAPLARPAHLSNLLPFPCICQGPQSLCIYNSFFPQTVTQSASSLLLGLSFRFPINA